MIVALDPDQMDELRQSIRDITPPTALLPMPVIVVLALASMLALVAAIGVVAIEGNVAALRDRAAAASVRAEIAEARAGVAEHVAIAATHPPRSTNAIAIDMIAQRTQWLHEVMLATCSADGWGRRAHLPDPPPGWAAIPMPDTTGPWAMP